MEKILIASPVEPSGVTWLINCLISLNLLCTRDRNSEISGTWEVRQGKYFLKSSQKELHRWLPALSKDGFNFDSGFNFEWSHDWLTERDLKFRKILFIRDPRSSLRSLYLRERPGQSYASWLFEPDYVTFLSRTEKLGLFIESWLSDPQTMVVRFEDYKLNPYLTLKSVLKRLEIFRKVEDIEFAVKNSTFELSQKTEKKYLVDNKLDDNTLMNRAGLVKEYEESSRIRGLSERIENRIGRSMYRLGYSDINQQNRTPIYLDREFFKNKIIPPEIVRPSNIFEDFFDLKMIFKYLFSGNVFIPESQKGGFLDDILKMDCLVRKNKILLSKLYAIYGFILNFK